MKKALLLCSFAICSLLAQAQFPVSGTIASTDPVFNRPDPGTPPTTMSVQGIGVYYDVVSFAITTPGVYTITSTTPTLNFDMVGFLYGPGGFTPSSPLTNVLVGDDDSGPGTLNFAITYSFTTPGTYYVVVTTLKPPLTGNYTLTITEPGPLPVRLVSFTATKSASGNLLKWTSSGETEIVGYQVQQSSNGASFKDVTGGSVKALNSSLNSDYSYTVAAPSQKMNFYRLKITEQTGATKFSSIVLVNNGKNNNKAISIFPNPTADYLNIQPTSAQNGKASLAIVSGAGQIVYKADYTISDGSIVTLDVKKLSVGSYTVRLNTANGETSSLNFIKR